MKRLFLIIVSIITWTLVYAQDYKVEFSINNDNTIATYKIENHTNYNLALMKGSTIDDLMRSYCELYYKTLDGRITSLILDVIPSKKMGISIEPNKSYIYQIDLTPYKKYNITTLEGCFRIIYKNAKDESVAKNIIKRIDLQKECS
ncbi:hypothetical protein QVN91_11120 [Bacteroides caecigallinarum]|nr:hypothetical protein [Bacteroides caecigallinarum]